MLINFNNDPDDIKFALVLGYAGSGKSYTCDQITCNDVIIEHHDEWVGNMYKNDQETIDYIKVIIPDAVCDNMVSKPAILAAILKDSTLGAMLSSYWRSLYNEYIRDIVVNADKIGSYSYVFEVPYYDEELHDVVMEYKDYFNVVLVDTPRSICYDRLKEQRNWSEYRIAMTLQLQDKMMGYIRNVLPTCDHEPMIMYTRGTGEKCFRTCRRCGVEIEYDGHKFSEVCR